MARYHKADRRYLGITNPQIDALCKEWRAGCTLDERTALAATLWDSNIHEARIAAGKLLTQARINPDDQVWIELLRWIPAFDAWAIADHACSAIARRLSSDPTRLDTVEQWTRAENLWVRRAALVATLPWTKQNHPTDKDLQNRDRILGWAATFVDDPEWFIQKSIAWWLRSLSKHDKPRVQTFLAKHGDQMKPFAQREASKYL